LLQFKDGKSAALPAGTGPAGNLVQSLLTDREGHLWAGTEAGLNRLRRKALTTLSQAEGLGMGAARCLGEVMPGVVWATKANSGLYRWDGKSFNRLSAAGLLSQDSPINTLLVTHDLGLAVERADRVVVLAEGRVVESGSAREVLTAPRHEYTRRLVAAAPSISATVLTEPEPEPASERASAADGGPVPVPPVLRMEGVSKEFHIRGRGGVLRAVDDVSFEVRRGRTTAVVGESGSGKTTVARMVLGLVPVTTGTIRLDGDDIVGMRGARLRAARRAMQPVFQDPYGSLDPMFSVERLVAEPLRIFGVGDKVGRAARVRELLDQVALPLATARRYPNELSGGQRQRVAIARALALDPALVVCDEAVSALDVLVQDQILRLLRTLQDELGVSYLFISHDLAVVREISHEVVVMKQGRAVEQGPVAEVLGAPRDPYTRQLLAAVPGLGVLA